MDKAELLKKIRTLEIKTRGLTKQVFSGEYHSAFKGRGMSFSEVREYQPGDDVRSIDWNVTARFNHPYVKVFEEERELTVILLVDLSASQRYGTKDYFKKDRSIELAAVLAFSASQNNDKIGAIFYTDKVEKYIPPKKGKSHILRIISELFEFKPSSKGTDINCALKFFNNVIKKRSIAFLISDFIGPLPGEDDLRIASRKHDVVSLQIIDPTEINIPDGGLLPLTNPETGQVTWVDTSSKKVRDHLMHQSKFHNQQLANLFSRLRVDNTQIPASGDYVPKLIRLFESRVRK